MPLLAGMPYAKDVVVILFAKNLGDVVCIRQAYRGMVAWDGLDRDGSRIFGVLLTPSLVA